MKYALFDIQATDTAIYHGPKSGFDGLKIQKRFVPADGGGDVHTQRLPSGHRRRFLLEMITITWERRSDRTGIQRRITAEGRTVLSSGEISSRSRGFEGFWSEPVPDDIMALAADHDPHLTPRVSDDHR